MELARGCSGARHSDALLLLIHSRLSMVVVNATRVSLVIPLTPLRLLEIEVHISVYTYCHCMHVCESRCILHIIYNYTCSVQVYVTIPMPRHQFIKKIVEHLVVKPQTLKLCKTTNLVEPPSIHWLDSSGSIRSSDDRLQLRIVSM